MNEKCKNAVSVEYRLTSIPIYLQNLFKMYISDFITYKIKFFDWLKAEHNNILDIAHPRNNLPALEIHLLFY